MSNRRFLVLSSLLAAGIVASLAIGTLGNPFVSAGYRPLKLPFSAFPKKLGEWTGTDDPLTEREMEIAGMDEYLRRQYRAPDGRSVMLYAAYYGNKARGMQAIYHNPTICFPAAGWKWAGSDQRTITLTDAARQFDVSLDTFRKPGEEIVVLNFFIVNGEVLEKPPRNKPFWIGLEKLSLSNDPGYFVQAQVVTVNRSDGADGKKLAMDFLARAGRPLFLHF